MENCSMFAATSPKSFYKALIVVAFFIATLESVYLQRYNGLSNHNGLPHSCCNLTLASRGAIAFIINTIIFHYMPKSNENAGMPNNSKHNCTSIGTKSVSELFHPELVEFVEQLRDMRKWFEAYFDNTGDGCEHIIKCLSEIENALISASFHIADLVAIEFQENVFYKD